MASPMNETWWSSFLSTHGRDSEEESAFLGYLVSHDIASDSGPDVLGEAYTQFHAYMLESGVRASADPGPSREELVAAQAVAGLVEHVPQSRTANPGMNKPLGAATHPQAAEVAKAQAAATSHVETPPAVQTAAPVPDVQAVPAAETHRGGRGRSE
jgi:hypothetical protein